MTPRLQAAKTSGRSSWFCTLCGTPRSADRAGAPASRPPAAESAHQPKRRRLPQGRATVAAAVVMAAGLSVLLAWRLIGHPATAAPVAAGSPSTPATTGTGATPSSSLRVSPVTPASAPAASDGPVPVSRGAAEQANAGQVAAFVGTYFAAINRRDYQAYASLFDDPARPDRNEQQFLSGYRTTTDSDPVLVALTPTSTGQWAATVTFVSHQSPTTSATQSSCPDWCIICIWSRAGTPTSLSSRPRAAGRRTRPADPARRRPGTAVGEFALADFPPASPAPQLASSCEHA